jgi:Fe-S-cluster containining protein
MLTDADVSRIVGATGLGPRAFVRFFGETELRMPKRHPFWIQFERRRAAMALRWGRDRCIFLDRDNQCRVYDERPLACREHPFTIRMSRTGAVEGLELSKIVDCLYELDGHVTKRQLARVSRWNEKESEEYQERIKVWNQDERESRSRARFMEFLGLDWSQGMGAESLHSRAVSTSEPFA